MTIVNFQEYALFGNKRGICPECGKRVLRTKKFWQTQSPFNKNDRGEIKSVEEIYAELKERIREWQSEPAFHAKCEP